MFIKSNKLDKLGVNYSPRKTSIIMRENNLVVVGYKKFKVTTTNSNHKYKVFDNLLERNFKVDKPNQVYVGKEYVYQTTFKTRAEAQLGIFDYIEAWL